MIDRVAAKRLLRMVPPRCPRVPAPRTHPGADQACCREEQGLLPSRLENGLCCWYTSRPQQYACDGNDALLPYPLGRLPGQVP